MTTTKEMKNLGQLLIETGNHTDITKQDLVYLLNINNTNDFDWKRLSFRTWRVIVNIHNLLEEFTKHYADVFYTDEWIDSVIKNGMYDVFKSVTVELIKQIDNYDEQLRNRLIKTVRRHMKPEKIFTLIRGCVQHIIDNYIKFFDRYYINNKKILENIINDEHFLKSLIKYRVDLYKQYRTDIECKWKRRFISKLIAENSENNKHWELVDKNFTFTLETTGILLLKNKDNKERLQRIVELIINDYNGDIEKTRKFLEAIGMYSLGIIRNWDKDIETFEVKRIEENIEFGRSKLENKKDKLKERINDDEILKIYIKHYCLFSDYLTDFVDDLIADKVMSKVIKLEREQRSFGNRQVVL